MKRTEDELKSELNKQIGYLQRSCADFDKGEESEAPRIAVTLRVLLHDTSASISLLKQLGVKDKMQYLDSASPIDPKPTGETHQGRRVMSVSGLPGLVAISPTRQGFKFLAPLDISPLAAGYIDFDSWWTEENIPGHEKRRHSRKWLITEMANKDGGAHVAPEVTLAYKELNNSSLGHTVIANGIEGYINSPAAVSVRQVAWEVLESIKQAGIL